MKYFFVVFFLVVSCGRECKEIADTQCYENSVYVCNTNFKWEILQECQKESKCKDDGSLAYCEKWSGKK